jgi:hypothetical protein
MTTTTRATAVRRSLIGLVLAVAVTGAAGCDRVSQDPIPTTVSGKRICGLFSDRDVRTVSGADPHVRSQHVNPEPVTGYLLDAVCEIDAGDVYVRVNVTWYPPVSRAEIRADLSQPLDGDARAFPADQGIGSVRTEQSAVKNIYGALLRGQYKINIQMQGVSDSRDPLADAQAFVLQAVTSLALPVSDTAERPKVAY